MKLLNLTLCCLLTAIPFSLAYGASSEKVLKETKDALRAVEKYSETKKNALEKALKKDISEIRSEMKKVENKTEDMTDQAMQNLEESLSKVEDQAGKLQKATATSWKDVTDQLAVAILEVDKNYTKAFGK